MYHHLAVLFLISRATGEVPSDTNPSTSSPANSNRLLETVPHQYCEIDTVKYGSDCEDQNISPGTTCNAYFLCPEHSFSIPSLVTCQENSEWAPDLDTVDPNCSSDSCPVVDGFLAYSSGGCGGQNELGYHECREQNDDGGVKCCAAHCQKQETCISFEVAKREFIHHSEPTKCYLSESCRYEDSQKLLYSDTCLYVEGDGNGLTPNSNNGGEASHYRHCEPSKVAEAPGLAEGALLFGTNCDGNILVGTSCDFWKNCKDEEYSIPGTMVCQEDGSWAGDTLDVNCHSTEPSFLTENAICSDHCSTSPTKCRACYDKVETDICPPNSIECDVQITENTTKFFEESRCLSYSMSQEECLASGGDFVVDWEVCVAWENGQENCITRGRQSDVSLSHTIKFSESQKACKVFYGYTCDEHSETTADIHVVLVHVDARCPTFEDWPVSCDLLAESNEVDRSTPSDGDDGDNDCLVYDSDISLADGTTQPIQSLEVGTNVALGKDGQSAIVFFTHADKTPVLRNLVTIKTQESNITATRNHLIFSSENEGVTLRNLRAFQEVKVGDFVLMDTEKGPVSTKVIDIVFETMLTRLYNPVPRAGYLIANKIFVASGSAFGVLPHWLQYPVVHAVSMLVCGISERACQIEEDDTKPRWVRRVQEWISATELKRVSSDMMLTGSYI